MEFSDVDEIIFLLKRQFGYDFSDYSRASLLRRINRFMDNNQLKSIVDLKFEIINNPAFFTQFVNEIVVNVSEFFRDPTFYKSLETNVFPYLESYSKVNIWSAGCSFGEETYSLAIMLKEFGLLNKSMLYATDISTNAIENSKKGIYQTKNFKDYSNNYFAAGGKESLSEYFVSDGKMSIIDSDLKRNTLFTRHNLVTDGVFKECQLILCRNVLIYFNESLQDKVLNLFYESLPIHGFLALGKKESMRFNSVFDKFKEIDKVEKIYQKIK